MGAVSKGEIIVDDFKKNVVYIYTDGSCNNHPKSKKHTYGGYGILMLFNEKMKMIIVPHLKTTSGRMELLAAIEGLSMLKGTKYPIVLQSDSEYVVNGCNKWLTGWAALGFTTIKNPKLWERMFKLRSTLDFSKITIKWVKGHAGNFGNEVADDLAGFAYKNLCAYHKIIKIIK